LVYEINNGGLMQSNYDYVVKKDVYVYVDEVNSSTVSYTNKALCRNDLNDYEYAIYSFANYTTVADEAEIVYFGNTAILDDGTIYTNSINANNGFFGGEINATGNFTGTVNAKGYFSGSASNTNVNDSKINDSSFSGSRSSINVANKFTLNPQAPLSLDLMSLSIFTKMEH
jgi:hypothetical protein